MAVEAMKKGAYDFMEKPVGDQTLLDRIDAALSEDQRRRTAHTECRSFQKAMDQLTAREREVLALLKAAIHERDRRDFGHQPENRPGPPDSHSRKAARRVSTGPHEHPAPR